MLIKYTYFLLGIVFLNCQLVIADEVLPVSSSIEQISNQTMQKNIDSILLKAFPGVPREEIDVKTLKGGFSGTAIYKVDVRQECYVLRLHLSTPSDQEKREHAALLEATARGIAPAIIYISEDHCALIMDFIDSQTLSLAEAKQPQAMKKIAAAIRQAHTIGQDIPASSDLFSNAALCYSIVIEHRLAPKQEIKEAIELLKACQPELSAYAYEKVNVHGDLNARNIFLRQEKVLFIDWAETSLEDPFYDLSYFALHVGYDEPQERQLLSFYLERLPTDREWRRYQLQKKMVLAFWSLTNLYLAEAQLKKGSPPIDVRAPLKEWQAYREIFAETCDELSAQYFYEFSRLCYKRAKNMP